MSKLDLTTLLGGKHFLIPYTLSINRFSIVLYSLVDIGANSYLFLNRPLASRLLKAIGTPI
jgi:hypothetical protein